MKANPPKTDHPPQEIGRMMTTIYWGDVNPVLVLREG
jgi:hypothetical protein